MGCRGGVAGGVVRGARMNVGVSEVATAEIDPGVNLITWRSISWPLGQLCSWKSFFFKHAFAAVEKLTLMDLLN